MAGPGPPRRRPRQHANRGAPQECRAVDCYPADDILTRPDQARQWSSDMKKPVSTPGKTDADTLRKLTREVADLKRENKLLMKKEDNAETIRETIYGLAATS